MKIYNSMGPNPHVVRMFLAEKGVTVPLETVDLMAGENRLPPYLAKNAMGQLPTLELADGATISEITVICEYLEEKHPSPSLVGATAEERAETRMWVRRVDLNICEPLTNGFRYSQGLRLFENRFRCLPEAADGLKALAQDNLTKLDGMIDGKTFLAGDRLTLADILLFCFLDFGVAVGQPLNADNKNVSAWFDRMKARPSASA
jgi:glutathione S-transferase